jgi:hypothetical protein
VVARKALPGSFVARPSVVFVAVVDVLAAVVVNVAGAFVRKEVRRQDAIFPMPCHRNRS